MNHVTILDLFSVFRNGSLFIGELLINRPPEEWKCSTSQVLNFERTPRVFDGFEMQGKHRKSSSSDGSEFWGAKCDIVCCLKKKEIHPAVGALKTLPAYTQPADRPRIKAKPPILTLVRRGGKSSFGETAASQNRDATVFNEAAVFQPRKGWLWRNAKPRKFHNFNGAKILSISEKGLNQRNLMNRTLRR